ncbi:MAG TPA: glycosyltransferase family 2 protein [Acetobacteraceae bacterium]|nr:glycosyltransferase family 2 protein [Acetobacteraceae bacterium]
MPRIVALSMVKNEQDIIEPFVRHTSMFVDDHVILDNGSVDETRRILIDLMREIDGVIVTTCSEFGYSQSERMTRLLRSCQTAFFADYVIFLDADEFISSATRAEFEAILCGIPAGGFGRIPWRTHVLAPFDRDPDHNDPPRSMPWRRANEHARYNAVLRLDGKYWHDLVVAQGNHDVTSSTARAVPAVFLDGLYLNHFPLRSMDQFLAKSIVGWMAYLGKDAHAGKKGDGYHWRHNFHLAVNGAPIRYEDLCDLSMRYDQPHREYDWSTDVVRDVPPDRYERRYSSGKYAEPLALVAKSWQATLEARDPLVTFTCPDVPVAADEKSAAETEFNAQWHWDNPFADVAPFRYLAEKYRPQSVLDVGCGIGAYVTIFKNLGVKNVFGADCIAKSATMLRDDEYRKVDLARPFSLGCKYDIVMCLEVAAHSPVDAAAKLLASLSSHAGGLIVFSAAAPGQPGHGRIGCIPIEQWLRHWQALGWSPSLQETMAMRALSTLSWFKHNIVVLRQGADRCSEAALRELESIGSLPFGWPHTNPGIRAEVLIEDVPHPPLGYKSEVQAGA